MTKKRQYHHKIHGSMCLHAHKISIWHSHRIYTSPNRRQPCNAWARALSFCWGEKFANRIWRFEFCVPTFFYCMFVKIAFNIALDIILKITKTPPKPELRLISVQSVRISMFIRWIWMFLPECNITNSYDCSQMFSFIARYKCESSWFWWR